MNPLQPGAPRQHYTASINSARSVETAGAQAQSQHPQTLSLASMSRNTLDTLDHANHSREPLAMRAIELIGSGVLSRQSTHGADAHYGPDNGELTAHVRLNEQSRYDLISIGSQNLNPLYFSAPPSPAHTRPQPPSVSSHPTAQRSRDQLAHARIRQNNSQDFSHDGLAGASAGVPGPDQTRPAQAARGDRITAPRQAAGGARYRTGTTDEQINAHLHNDDGSLRTATDVASALHADGLGAAHSRIRDLLRATGETRPRFGTTDEQINARLHNDNGELRSGRDVMSALRADGLGAADARIRDLLRQASRGQQ